MQRKARKIYRKDNGYYIVVPNILLGIRGVTSPDEIIDRNAFLSDLIKKGYKAIATHYEGRGDRYRPPPDPNFAYCTVIEFNAPNFWFE